MKYVSVRQAADFLSCSERTVRRLIDAAKLGYVPRRERDGALLISADNLSIHAGRPYNGLSIPPPATSVYFTVEQVREIVRKALAIQGQHWHEFIVNDDRSRMPFTPERIADTIAEAMTNSEKKGDLYEHV